MFFSSFCCTRKKYEWKRGKMKKEITILDKYKMTNVSIEYQELVFIYINTNLLKRNVQRTISNLAFFKQQTNPSRFMNLSISQKLMVKPINVYSLGISPSKFLPILNIEIKCYTDFSVLYISYFIINFAEFFWQGPKNDKNALRDIKEKRT